jgi:hypothetical protein
MYLSLITLFVALSLSVIAAFYSIAGLAAIFAAAVIPIMIMGTVLELAKITVTLWLHEYWNHCRLLMKIYLVPAVIMLMLITSMGIFGFLSKAHSDQSLISGDVQSKIAVYDEKIKTSKENIDANRKALKQLDEAVDQVMGRSTDEKGADKAVAIRRGQSKDRARLQAEIAMEQKAIASLNEERAPIAAEVRKVEAEVGPIKYIAALIYSDTPDVNVLEHAVRWVIILLVCVFDPLAIMMLLASTESLKWVREKKQQVLTPLAPGYEQDDKPLTKDQINQIQESVTDDLPTSTVVTKTELFPTNGETLVPNVHSVDTHPYLTNPGRSRPEGWEPVAPVVVLTAVASTTIIAPDVDSLGSSWGTTPIVEVENTPVIADDIETPVVEVENTPVVNNDNDDDIFDDMDADTKAAARRWKEEHSGHTLKFQRRLLESGQLQQLPWMAPEYYFKLVPDNLQANETQSGFGIAFPVKPNRGDSYLRVDRLPSVLYKFNGTTWIEVDKTVNEHYAHNEAYIDHLIAKIDSGEYDPDLLSEAERDQIERRLTGN